MKHTCVGSKSETVPLVALGKEVWSSDEAWLSALQAGKYLDARENACRAQEIYLHANSQRTGEMSRYIYSSIIIHSHKVATRMLCI